METTVEMVLAHGATWVGRKMMGPRAFRTQFGVYPSTAVWILAHCPNFDVESLLKALWWLKLYPTETIIQNHRVSPSRFRKQLWEVLHVLALLLPEVRVCPDRV